MANTKEIQNLMAELEAQRALLTAEREATIAERAEMKAILEAAIAAKAKSPVGTRGGSIAPLMAPLVAILTQGSATVGALAETLGITEMQVRHAIDLARGKGGYKIERLAPRTFGFRPVAQPVAAIAS